MIQIFAAGGWVSQASEFDDTWSSREIGGNSLVSVLLAWLFCSYSLSDASD